MLVGLLIGLRKEAQRADLWRHIFMHRNPEQEIAIRLVLRHFEEADHGQFLGSAFLRVSPIAQRIPLG